MHKVWNCWCYIAMLGKLAPHSWHWSTVIWRWQINAGSIKTVTFLVLYKKNWRNNRSCNATKCVVANRDFTKSYTRSAKKFCTQNVTKGSPAIAKSNVMPKCLFISQLFVNCEMAPKLCMESWAALLPGVLANIWKQRVVIYPFFYFFFAGEWWL